MSAQADLVAQLRATANEPGTPARHRVDAARKLLCFGYVNDALAIAQRLMGQPAVGQNALIRTCRRILEGERLRFGAGRLGTWGDDPGGDDVMIAPGQAARRVVLLFSGRGATFLGPMDAAFADRPDTSLIFLRNRNGCMFMADMDGLGHGYAANLARLREIIAEICVAGPGREGVAVYTVGLSIGGYAALRFGLDLGARGVLAFSPLTTLDAADFLELPPEQRPDLAEADQAIHLLAPGMAVDLRRLYGEARRTPRLILCYGGAHPGDRWAAERMAGVARTELEPIEGFDGHRTLQEARRRHMLDALVERLLDA